MIRRKGIAVLGMVLCLWISACGRGAAANMPAERAEMGKYETETRGGESDERLGGGKETAHRQDENRGSAELRALSATEVPTEEVVTGEQSHILIAYFTWAENTKVEHPETVDVDATTSASVLMPGNVGLLARWIQEETGGDCFSIVTKEPYSSDYDTCLNRAIEEHDKGARPELVGNVEHMENYDIVFLGFPNWWYSCPMALLTFIEENDLSGKTIIPFCSHGTGGFAASLRDIGNVLPKDCTVLEEFGAYRPEVAASRDELLRWLKGLGIDFKGGGASV